MMPFPCFLQRAGEFLVAAHEAMLRNGGDIGTQGQDFGPGGHDVVGGDIVPHLEQHRRFHRLGQGRGFGEGLDVGAADDFHRVHIGLIGRGHDHIVVDEEALGQGDDGGLAQGAGIGQHAGRAEAAATSGLTR